MKASLAAAVLILAGLIVVVIFLLIYCEVCGRESVIFQYMVLFFGSLLILIGLLLMSESGEEVQHIHYRHRHY